MNAMRAKGTIELLDSIVLYGILLEAFFVSISPMVAEIAILAGFAAFLVKWRFDASFHFQRTRFFWPITVFAVCGLASVAVSPDPAFSFYNYYNLVCVYIITYIMITQNIRSNDDIKKLVKALAYSAVLVLAYGLYQVVFGIDTADMKWVDGNAFPELKKRIFSTWENPNIFAAYLDILICILLGFFAKLDDRKNRQIIGAFIIVAAFCLAMTYARGACLAIAVILAGYGILKDKRILLALVAVGAAALALDPVLMERLTNMFSVADTSSEMRVAMWESTVQMIMDHPVLGIGWGAYWMVYPAYDTYIVDGSVTLVHAHNIYLNYICEVGILGGIAYFVWLFGSMLVALTTDRIYNTPMLNGLMLGLGLALVSVALNGITDDVLFNIPSSMLLWMLCGLIVVLDQRDC